jgi:hypothetical protein
MMKIRVVAAAILIFLSAGAMAAEKAGVAALDAEIARFLTALEFGTEARAAYAKAVESGELDDETARALSKITAQRFVELAVPAFRRLVSLEEAKAMADFYNSDAMRAMLDEQKRSGSPAPVARTPEHAAAVQRFVSSKAGQAAMRIQQELSAQSFLEQFETALQKELEKG